MKAVHILGIIIITMFTGVATAQTPKDCESVYSISCRTMPYLSEKTNTRPQSDGSHDDGNKAVTKDGRFISFSFGGWSSHETGNKPNFFNQVNPTLGIDIWYPGTFLWGKPFIGFGHIFQNSRRGSTSYFTLANEWKLVSGKYVDLCGGVGIMHLKYRDGMAKPGKRSIAEGEIPLVYGCLDFNQYPIKNFSVRVVPLGSKITYFYLIYHW